MTKLSYERPVITKLNTGAMNKFGTRTEYAPVTQIDGVPVKKLIADYGSPCFVISERTIRDTYKNAVRAFKSRYPKVQFAWSYKTNYLNAVCNVFHSEGSWAEVVSIFEYEKAIADFKAALQVDSSSTEALNNMGLYYCDAGKFGESIEALNKAIKMKPDYKMALYNLGNTYAKMGDYRTAMFHYNRAVKVDPKYSDALNNIGNCYSVLNLRDSAYIYYQQATAADPTNTKALINMGVILSQMGDSVNGRKWFDKARQLGANI